MLGHTLEALLHDVKTKRYTMTRLKRILVYALFGVTADLINEYDRHVPEYIRVLGVSEKGEDLLPIFDKTCSPPLIFSPAGHDKAFSSLRFDIAASDIYALSQTKAPFFNSARDFTEKLIKVAEDTD